MAMSKRHFEVVAAEFRRAHTLVAEVEAIDPGDPVAKDTARTALDGLARNLADAFARENSNFDRTRFLSACHAQDSFDMAGRLVAYSRDPNGVRTY